MLMRVLGSKDGPRGQQINGYVWPSCLSDTELWDGLGPLLGSVQGSWAPELECGSAAPSAQLTSPAPGFVVWTEDDRGRRAGVGEPCRWDGSPVPWRIPRWPQTCGEARPLCCCLHRRALELQTSP